MLRKDVSWLAESFYNTIYRDCSDDIIGEAAKHIENARVGDVFIEYGRVSARFTNDQKRTVRVLILVPEISDSNWYRFFSSLTGHPYVLSRVLAGSMPKEFIVIFKEIGVEFVPEISNLTFSVDDEKVDVTDTRVLAVLEKFVSELLVDPYALCKLLGRTYSDIEKGLRDMLLEQGMFSKKNTKAAPPVKIDRSKYFLGENQGPEIIVKADELPASLLRRLDYLFPEHFISGVDKNMEAAYERVSRLAQSLARFM